MALHENSTSLTAKQQDSDNLNSEANTKDSSLWSFLPASTLLEWLQTNNNKNSKKQEIFEIIDVREDDEYGPLCIKKANHHAFEKFKSNLDHIITLYGENPCVIFHCTDSEMKGPSAATLYAKSRTNDTKHTNYPPQTIYVLSGGFKQFSTTYPPAKSKYADLYVTIMDEITQLNKTEKNDEVLYISGNTLVKWLDDNLMTEIIQIIDVRDDDFVNYKIKTAMNYPSYQFNDQYFVRDLIDKYENKRHLIFHCAYSQQRGPRAAGIYYQLKTFDRKYISYPKQNIYVLEHGFRGFFKTHPTHCVKI